MGFQYVVVTGGAGFVGSSLAIAFKRDFPDVKITCLDSLKRRGSECNLGRLKTNGIEFLHGDIRNEEDFSQIDRCDLVIDCAAEPSVLAGYVSDPRYILETNLCGTLNTLEFARQHDAQMVFLSTSRVYPIEPIRNLKFKESETRFDLDIGKPTAGLANIGIGENFSVSGARSLYGASKLASETIISEYIDMFGMKIVINRCAVLAGPWQMGRVDQGVVALWVARHLFGGKLAYIGYGGTGKQVRDILHVQDLYDLLQTQLADMHKYCGVIYNVGGGKSNSVSLLELTGICEEITGRSIEIGKSMDERQGDVPWFVTDCTKIEQATGWTPRRSVSKIVADTVEWMRANETLVRPYFT